MLKRRPVDVLIVQQSQGIVISRSFLHIVYTLKAIMSIGMSFWEYNPFRLVVSCPAYFGTWRGKVVGGGENILKPGSVMKNLDRLVQVFRNIWTPPSPSLNIWTPMELIFQELDEIYTLPMKFPLPPPPPPSLYKG